MRLKQTFKMARFTFAVMCLSAALCVFMTNTVMAADDKEPGKPAQAAATDTELAKKSQNPIADMMSIPLQYNAFTGGALGNSTMSVLNFQPVIPSKLNDEWNLITRAIVPFMSVPTSHGKISGIGDSSVTFFFSPRNTGATTWGVGPILQLPTASDDALGTQTFGLGPSAVIVKMEKQWVYGGLFNYVHSVGEEPNGVETSKLFIQPFANYNLPQRRGMAISFSPGITCDYTRSSGDRWTVPLGLQVSQVTKMGKQPISLTLGAYKNVIHTSSDPDWNYRFQLTFLFPK